MTQKQVDVWYRYQAITAKPLYISNDDVRRVAADVRGQLVSAVDSYRLTRDHLLAIERIQANGVRLESMLVDRLPGDQRAGRGGPRRVRI